MFQKGQAPPPRRNFAVGGKPQESREYPSKANDGSQHEPYVIDSLLRHRIDLVIVFFIGFVLALALALLIVRSR